MVKISDTILQNIEFRHFVVDRQGVIFASGRDASNKVCNFIINRQTGTVLTQVNSHFEQLSIECARYITSRIAEYQGILPTYRVVHFEFN